MQMVYTNIFLSICAEFSDSKSHLDRMQCSLNYPGYKIKLQLSNKTFSVFNLISIQLKAKEDKTKWTIAN